MMNQFRSFVTFVRKEFLHIFRDSRTMVILFISPVLLMLLVSYAMSTEIRNVNVAVLSPDKDAGITALTAKIDASVFFRVTGHPESPAEAEAMLRSGKADVAILFNNAFSARLLSPDASDIDIMVDASNPNNASPQAMYIMGVINDWMNEKFSSASADSGKGTLSANIRMLFNPRLNSSFDFIPGLLGLILLTICSLMTSVSIVREKEMGTMSVLLVSPVKPTAIIFAKLTPYFALCIIDLALILLMSHFILGMPINGSLFWIIVVSLIFILLGLSIGLFISSLVKTQTEASLACGIGLLFATMILSGMMFPIESMPEFFQWVTGIIPAKWYVIIMRRLMIQGTPFIYCIKEFVIICLMTVAVLIAALAKFNDRLE